MTKDEALKITIELMERFLEYDGISSSDYIDVLDACKEALAQPLTRDWKETIDERVAKDDAFKQALEQPAQEPVALVIEDKLADWSKPYVAVKWNKVDFEIGTKFYTHPAPSWQGLSDDEIAKVFDDIGVSTTNRKIYRAIEQALKDKNS